MAEKTQKELGIELLEAVKTGSPFQVKLLLKAGAQVDGNDQSGAPLCWAAYNGRLEIVDILLTAGADPTIKNGGKTPVEFARDQGRSDVVERLLQTPEEVIFQRPLSDRTLEEIFNFSSLERISLIRKSPKGDVEAVTRQKFSDIRDEPVLQKAFEEHVRRGGKTDERLVFPYLILKPKRAV